MTAAKGKFPPGDLATESRRGADADLERPRRACYPGTGRQADVRQALEGLPRGTGRGTTSRATSASQPERPARRRRDVGPHVPGAGVRGGPSRRRRKRSRRGQPRRIASSAAPSPPGRPADPARGRLRARVHTHVTLWRASRHGGCHRTWSRPVRASRRTSGSSSIAALVGFGPNIAQQLVDARTRTCPSAIPIVAR